MTGRKFLGIFKCPVCKKTKRYYGFYDKKSLNGVWKNHIVYCEGCGVLRYISKNESEFRVTEIDI